MDLLMSCVESEVVGEDGSREKYPEAAPQPPLAEAAGSKEEPKWGRLSRVEKQAKKKQKKTRKTAAETASVDPENRNFDLLYAEHQVGRTALNADIVFNMPFVSGKVSA
jgi:hypothetical protein